MGRIVYAEECLLSYLESLAQSDAYTVGLILGQVVILSLYLNLNLFYHSSC